MADFTLMNHNQIEPKQQTPLTWEGKVSEPHLHRGVYNQANRLNTFERIGTRRRNESQPNIQTIQPLDG